MRILIIEDGVGLAELLKSNFVADGYTVDCLSDGEEAGRRILSSHKEYDLVILDWMLPQKSGLQICTEVRKQGIALPILVLTARFDIKDKITALDAGADDYMIKPFSFEELEARVRALMRRPVQTLSAIREVGPLRLDSATHRVTINARNIRLTAKEFSILEYLMRYVGKVVSRQEIVSHVWDFDFNSFSNVMDVHMKNLRRKLVYRKHVLIETVRGVGYRVKEWA